MVESGESPARGRGEVEWVDTVTPLEITGMDSIRGLGRGATTAIWLVALILASGLIAAAVLDRGPTGVVRLSAFPMALAVWDPFVWDCLWNSVAVASVVAMGSLAVGIGLARIVAGRRFWGRTPLAALTLAPLVVSPVFGAIGLRGLLGPPDAWPRVAVGGWISPGDWGAWLGWIWLGLAGGVPLVTMASAHALSQVGPAGRDAARLAGASRRQVWRRLIRPLVRPEAARAAAGVFAWTLLEPGPPLVLGLRRTLSFQAVEAALGPEPFPRAAVLTLAGLAIATIGRLILRSWGGRPAPSSTIALIPRGDRASARRSSASIAVLVTWVALAWLPILGLGQAALAGAPGPSRDGMHPASIAVARLRDDPESRRLAANSLALGVAVAVIGIGLSWALAGSTPRRRGRAEALTDWIEAIPPLAWGVGALTLPGLARLGAVLLGASGGHAATAGALGRLAGALDPDRTPGVLLVMAVVASRLPTLARGAVRGRDTSRPAPSDAALSLGASPRRAGRMASGGAFGGSAGALWLTVALAATSLAPALLLTPTLETRTVAPGVLILADEPGGGLARAGALAIAATAVNLVALAAASRGRSRPIGAWFRG